MLRFLIGRILAAIPVLFILSIVTFAIIKAPPGDYGDYIRAQLMNQGGASYEEAEAQANAYRKEHGLTDPVPIQYVHWMTGILTRGDFGESYFYNKPVSRVVAERLPRTLLLDAIFWAAVIEVATIPLFGYLTDKIGRRPFYFAGVIFTIAFAFPLFWLLDMKTPWIVMTAVIIALNFGHGLMFAPESAYFPELFGARVRYSGASFGFQASAAIGGGFAPIIATALAAYMGGTAGVSVMLILLALLTLTATFFAHETKDQPLLK